MSSVVFGLGLLLYLTSSILFGLGFFFNWQKPHKIGQLFFILGLLAHVLFTFMRYLEARYTPITNIFESLSFLCLATAACFIYLSKMHGLKYLYFFVSTTVSVILAFSFFLPSQIGPLPPVLRSFWLPLHTIFAFIGNAMFLIGFITSLLYILSERRIKERRLSFPSRDVPSLEVLDAINYRCLAIGFLMLTIGIVTGSIWASFAWGSYWSWDPKETWSLITWIVYAIIIHNRLRIGWRGKRTAYMMILGFFCVLVTFLGVNLLFGGMHSYV